MNVGGEHFRTIWVSQESPSVVQIIDQRHLPFEFVVEDLVTVDDVAAAIQEMHVRGAGLIGATAGYGMYIAALTVQRDSTKTFVTAMEVAGEQLKATRPTAVNLEWAVHRQLAAMARQAAQRLVQKDSRAGRDSFRAWLSEAPAAGLRRQHRYTGVVNG